MSDARACDSCLRRTSLVASLAPRIERARARRRPLPGLLALPDERLLELGGAEDRSRQRAFSPEAARADCAAAGIAALCRHAPRYPDRLRQIPDCPAVLHVLGDSETLGRVGVDPVVAIVGARRASPYGLEVARALARGLAAAGCLVVSGMAMGVDSAAHAGALEVAAPTVAVLAGGADVPYPRAASRLHARIARSGCVVSEMPPGARALRWGFPARNRIIAGLADLVVVVEAAERSGALITADLARDAGREVGAVPGRVTSPQSAGANALLADGAHVIRSAQDVLDVLLGPGARSAPPSAPDPARLEADLQALLSAVAAGTGTVAELATDPRAVEGTLRALARLELLGHVRRTPGGRYVAVA